MLSARKPRRCYALRVRGRPAKVYRATREHVRGTMPGRPGNVEALDQVADESLEWLASVLAQAEARRLEAAALAAIYARVGNVSQ